MNSVTRGKAPFFLDQALGHSWQCARRRRFDAGAATPGSVRFRPAPPV